MSTEKTNSAGSGKLAALAMLAGGGALDLLHRSFPRLGRNSNRSKYQPKRAPKSGPGDMTRQRHRAAANRSAFETVKEKNPAMPRHERRLLARAYAVQIWRPAHSEASAARKLARETAREKAAAAC